MDQEMLLAAIGCGRLPKILDITAKYSFVIFGTMDGKVLADFTASPINSSTSAFPVYFYETG
jgi:hypothetical protein